jgi:glycosyltransferase involved in cell wall biosynthesis
VKYPHMTPTASDSDRPDVTVVVPSFNNADYLDRAIRSAFALKTVSVEVIIVDDGSTDHTVAVAQSLQREFSSLIYVWKPNGGLSSARNFGISKAKGRYIVLLDADDELISADLKPVIFEGSDMYRIGVEEVGLDGAVSVNTAAGPVMSGVDFMLAAFRLKSFYTPSWAYIYRRDWLIQKGITFTEGLIHEDMLFSVQSLMLAGSVSSAPVVLYRYYRRPGSITTSTLEANYRRRIASLGKIVNELVSVANTHTDLDLSYWITNTVDHAYQIALKARSRQTKIVAAGIVLKLWMNYRGYGGTLVARNEQWRARKLFAACLLPQAGLAQQGAG